MKKFAFLLALSMICFAWASCDTKNKQLIIGEWRAVEWLANGTPTDYNIAGTFFSFNDDGKYTYTYSGDTENGKYFITNSQLYTTPEGGEKMMVKVSTLTQDTLVMDMNRGGIAEQLILVRN